MVLSLLARRYSLALACSLRPAVLARRTLFATPQLNLTAANVSEGTAKTPSETAKKKATKPKSVAHAKRGRPSKNTAEAKQQKEEKKRVRIPKDLKPPKRAPGPYLIFYTDFIRSQPKPRTLQEVQELAKRAAEIWRGYSMTERQPFYDENEARKTQVKQEMDEFFRNKSPSDLKQLNAIRKAQGKYKIHSTLKPSLPISPFLSFSNEFRKSPEGQAVIDVTSPEKSYIVRSVLAAAERWRSMSTEEKAPYLETYKKAKEELKAEQAQT